MHRQKAENVSVGIIAARGEGVRLRNAKEGQGKVSSLAKRVSGRGRH